MNPYLEHACRWFGASSCESATGMQYMAMVFSAAVIGIVTVWSASKLAGLRG